MNYNFDITIKYPEKSVLIKTTYGTTIEQLMSELNVTKIYNIHDKELPKNMEIKGSIVLKTYIE